MFRKTVETLRAYHPFNFDQNELALHKGELFFANPEEQPRIDFKNLFSPIIFDPKKISIFLEKNWINIDPLIENNIKGLDILDRIRLILSRSFQGSNFLYVISDKYSQIEKNLLCEMGLNEEETENIIIDFANICEENELFQQLYDYRSSLNSNTPQHLSEDKNQVVCFSVREHLKCVLLHNNSEESKQALLHIFKFIAKESATIKKSFFMILYSVLNHQFNKIGKEKLINSVFNTLKFFINQSDLKDIEEHLKCHQSQEKRSFFIETLTNPSLNALFWNETHQLSIKQLLDYQAKLTDKFRNTKVTKDDFLTYLKHTSNLFGPLTTLKLFFHEKFVNNNPYFKFFPLFDLFMQTSRENETDARCISDLLAFFYKLNKEWKTVSKDVKEEDIEKIISEKFELLRQVLGQLRYYRNDTNQFFGEQGFPTFAFTCFLNIDKKIQNLNLEELRQVLTGEDFQKFIAKWPQKSELFLNPPAVKNSRNI